MNEDDLLTIYISDMPSNCQNDPEFRKAVSKSLGFHGFVIQYHVDLIKENIVKLIF